jgi:hypothetical protein
MSSERVDQGFEMPVCPRCGNDGTEDDILYVAWIESSHSVRGGKDGAVEILAGALTREGSARGPAPCFECRRGAGHGEGPVCGHRWPVGASVVFVAMPTGVANRCGVGVFRSGPLATTGGA